MNRREYLLACLAEECAEVQHVVGKALRFGLENVNPTTRLSNTQGLVRELSDVLAVVGMLIEDGALPEMGVDVHIDIQMDINTKQEKVERLMEYSRGRGTLT